MKVIELERAKMKTCLRCGETWPLSEFYKRKASPDGRQNWCKECALEYNRERLESSPNKVKESKRALVLRNLKYRNSYLSRHPCVECGNDEIAVLVFDHVKGTKKASVSTMIYSGYSLEAIQKEMDKCQVLCANCHARNHSQDRFEWGVAMYYDLNAE